MMNTHFFAVLLVAGLLMISSVQTYQLSNKDEIVLANLMLRRDLNVRSKNPYINILNGILRSNKFVRYATEIPCNIIQTLENDANEAENFVKQIQQGKVPDIIEHLPQEILDAFSDVVNIALTLPTEIEGAAEAAVTEAVKVFNDIESGAIVKDIEQLPGVVVSEITADWGEFTAGLVDDWNAVTHEVACFFGDCATATPASGPCIPESTTGVYTTGSPDYRGPYYPNSEFYHQCYASHRFGNTF